MPLIRGTTKVVGVMAYPVGHSGSPAMHNAAFEALGLDYCYVPFEVPPEKVAWALEGMKALGIVGLNVTVPLKEKVMPYLDEITEEARLIGAVNTIHNQRGRLLGDNTDGRGFVLSLRERGMEVAGKKVVLLGAGGAARAISVALLREGVSTLWLANRTLPRARDLAAHLEEHFGPGQVVALPLETKVLWEPLQEADLIVNATSAGMHPYEEEMPLEDLPPLGPHVWVYDIVYNPRWTRFLQRAREREARTVDGTDMLVYQGALAFHRWTGCFPPVEVMREALLSFLQGR